MRSVPRPAGGDEPRPISLISALLTACTAKRLQSEECDECRGLPEEMSHVLQALRRNYAGGQAAGGGAMYAMS